MQIEGKRESARCAFTVQEFCDAHRISRSMLYELWNAGRGPRVLKAGVKNVITAEAAAEWRAEGLVGGNDRSARRTEPKLLRKIIADHIGNRARAATGNDRRTVGERNLQAAIAQSFDEARAPVSRHVLHEPHDIGDALGGREPAHRAHRAFAIERIDPRTERYRHREPGQQKKQCLPEQASGEEAGHAPVTAAVKV